MPFVPNTPEAHSALLNPPTPTVCRGVSNTGEPCKKELSTSPAGQPSSGIITVVGKQRAYFCARHEDQAKDVVLRHTASFARKRALLGRGSMDTLIEQVELLVGGPGAATQTTVVSTTKKVPRKQDPFRPVVVDSEEEEGEEDSSGQHSPIKMPPRPRRKEKKKHGLLARLFLCCFSGDDDDFDEKRAEAELREAAAKVVDPTTPKKGKGKKSGNTVAFTTDPPTPPMPMMYPPKAPAGSAMAKNKGKAAATAGGQPSTPSDQEPDDDVKPLDLKLLTPEQRKLLKLIPSHIRPSAALTRLQTELLKPFSEKDEPGYIYMFWLTDSPFSPASTPDASPSKRLMNAATTSPATPGGSAPKLLFKIGRAVNVQRRLHQWTSQCGYNLSLIRYYPHTSASSPGVVARMVPNVNRVERLIHLELSCTPGANPWKKCDVCGKTHKEWFEVPASRDGVLGVDALIKRWCSYAEKASPKTPSNPKGKAPATTTPTTTTLPLRPAPARKSPPAPAAATQMYDKKPKPKASPKASSSSSSPARTPKKAAAAAAPAPKKTTPRRKKKAAANDSSDDSWGEQDYSDFE